MQQLLLLARPHRLYPTLEGLFKGSSFPSGQLPEGETLPFLSLSLTVPRYHCSSVGHTGITTGRELRPVGLAVTSMFDAFFWLGPEISVTQAFPQFRELCVCNS